MSRRGFTLVEIMIAVTIVTMMGVIIYGMMTATARSREVSYTLQERYQTGRIAMSRMRRDLESAYLSRHRNQDNYPKTSFLGREDRVDFTYLGHLKVAEGVKESDQGAVSFFLESDPDNPGTKALMRREKVPVDDRPDKGGVVHKLAERVKKLEFEYWDPNDQDWANDWKAELADLEPADAGAAIGAAVGGATGQALATAANRLRDAEDALTEEEDEYVLPSRVRIRLLLADEADHEYLFETQARIYAREPLKW